MQSDRRLSVLSCAVAATAATLGLGTTRALATVAFDASVNYTQTFDALPGNATTDYRTWFDDNASPPTTGGGSSSNPGAGLAGWFLEQTTPSSPHCRVNAASRRT